MFSFLAPDSELYFFLFFSDFSGLDTYDGSTRLIDGICFENKLYSPMNGSAYNIATGEVELGPAMDDLPRFFVEEVIYNFNFC